MLLCFVDGHKNSIRACRQLTSCNFHRDSPNGKQRVLIARNFYGCDHSHSMEPVGNVESPKNFTCMNSDESFSLLFCKQDFTHESSETKNPLQNSSNTSLFFSRWKSSIYGCYKSKSTIYHELVIQIRPYTFFSSNLAQIASNEKSHANTITLVFRTRQTSKRSQFKQEITTLCAESLREKNRLENPWVFESGKAQWCDSRESVPKSCIIQRASSSVRMVLWNCYCCWQIFMYNH